MLPQEVVLPPHAEPDEMVPQDIFLRAHTCVNNLSSTGWGLLSTACFALRTEYYSVFKISDGGTSALYERQP